MNITKERTEAIQLLSLKPKHHNPPPKPVVSNTVDHLTPDIVWSDPVPKCFLYSCLAVAIAIFILIIHNIYNGRQHNNNNNVISNMNPHIICFIFDDLGASDISLNGASEYTTPNIDALASNGIQLSQHYVSPVCSATRSALLTGTFAFKMGLQGVVNDYIHPSSISHIPIKYETIANHLQNIGYNTLAYGKWHAGYSKASYTPTHRGFDHHTGYYQYAIDPYTKYNVDAWDKAKDWFMDGEFDDNPQYASDILLERILNDVDDYNEGDGALFMYIALSNPHYPVPTPDEFNEEYMHRCQHIENAKRRNYCLSITYLDIAIGQIIEKLKSNGLYENSVITMLSDNGPDIASVPASVYPLRGGKYTLFQGGVKTMAVISGGMVPNEYKGMSSNIIVSAVDWMPTLLHFTDFYRSFSLNIDGIDLYDEIFDVTNDAPIMHMSKQREYLILSMEYEDGAYINTGIIYSNYKLLINNKLSLNDESCNVRSADPHSDDAQFASTIIDDGVHVPDLMLFDLEHDPNEYNELLNGKGSANHIFKDPDNSFRQLIVTMIEILDLERENQVNEIRTQSFEHFEETEPNTIDAHVVDGVHKPFQSENENEFPAGYDY